MPKLSWLEALRIVATSAVIGIHVLADMVGASYILGSKRWWLANMVDGALRWSVPVFIIVSGYVLLARHQTLKMFYQKRLSRLALPLVFWIVFYLIWTQVLATRYATPLATRDLLNLVVQGVPYYHLWYLYMLLGLYLLTPWLNLLLERLSQIQVTVTCVVLLLLAVLSSASFSLSRVPFILWFLPFLGYYIFGYWLRQQQVTLPKAWLIATASLAILVTGVGSYLEAKQLGTNFGAYMYGYTSPNVMFVALAIVMLFKQSEVFWRRQFEIYPGLQRLSDASFMAYLLHPFLLDLLHLALPIARWHPILSVFVVPILFIMASWVVAVLVRRLPFARYLA